MDAAWPEHLVAMEYEGTAPHGPRSWARGEARDAELEALGWRIVPVTKADVRPGHERRLRDDLLAAVGRAAA